MGIVLTRIGEIRTGIFDDSAAEIPAFDPASSRLFVVNGSTGTIDVFDLSDPEAPVPLPGITLPTGLSPNSVAVKGGLVAVAAEADPVTDPGQVLFYDTAGTLLSAVTVGALPDMVTFSPDGTKVLVANEGEPDGGIDPDGSVAIIDISGGAASASVQFAIFDAFDGQEATLRAEGVRIFPGQSPSSDFEPEYIAFSDDGATAYVTLQEANSVAVVDVATATVTDILPLGAKDHSLPGNGIDASDRDSAINIANWPVFGLYMPDAIGTYQVGGVTYFVTANEGDARDEEARVKDLTLDPTAFPNAAALKTDAQLGRLTVSNIDGDGDGDGDYDQLFAYGSRSFSIWDANGNLVFDSGDDFEQVTASLFPSFFNSDNTANNLDNRSDNKGPEPEGVAIGSFDGKTYAFVGLERIGGVMTYDITDPNAVTFVDYINPRDFTGNPGLDTAGDLGPEGLVFVAPEDSPTGLPLLIVANEVSGSTAIFQVTPMLNINEFSASHTSFDTREYVEIFGDPNTDYSAYSILHIEGDATGGGAGTIDSVFNLGTTDAQGFWWTGFLPQDSIENGTITLKLVRDFTGTVGQDLDTNNDGILDATPWGAVIDDVGVNDGGAGDRTYASVTLGVNYDGLINFAPGGASRLPDGQDTETTADWLRNDFDLAGFPGFFGTPIAGEAFNTPGEENQAVPTGVTAARIFQIQGAGHTSPFAGQQVTTTGIVTAIDTIGSVRGFWLQDAVGDGNIATSDGIFVFTGGTTPAVTIGDEVRIDSASVLEFRSSTRPSDLTLTELTGATFTVVSSGNALPAAQVIGQGGRVPPTTVIDDDGLGSFDPTTDGIDFYESLEGMRVQVNDAVVVQPQPARFGEIAILADDGAGAGVRSNAGGLVIQPGDFNPGRIIIDDAIQPSVTVNVGDTFDVPIAGVLDYTFGNYKLLNTAPLPSVTSGGAAAETTSLVGTATQLTVASFNVLNLDPSDGDPNPANNDQLDRIASQILNNLGAPDIIGLQEIQDNSGTSDNGVTAADQTFQELIDAIVAQGGPTYAYAQIDPDNNADGGAPGSNIRVGFLYNPERVSFDPASLVRIEHPAFDEGGDGSPEQAGFEGTRKPLVGVFTFNAQEVTVIVNHLKSKTEDDPLFGTNQPPVETTLEQRVAQAEVINDYVQTLLSADPDAKIVVLGDLNDFDFSDTLSTLKGSELSNLIDALPLDDRYSFIFDGNSQTLDHILVSDALLGAAGGDTLAEVDIVHANTNLNDTLRASDHDPVVARLTVEPPLPNLFSFQLLHASDLEGGVEAIDRAPNFAAIVDALEDAAGIDASVTISAGDNYIPSPFFSAASDPSLRPLFNSVYNQLFGLDPASGYNVLSPSVGRADITLMNIIGFDASALGNHEFDLGTREIASIIGTALGGIPGPVGDSWVGAQFPYLSSNLNFLGDSNISALFTSAILPSSAYQNAPNGPAGPKIAPSTIIERGGEKIGVVGATTPLLESISSPGATRVIDPDGDGNDNDMVELAGILQPVIDALKAQGVNKIILTTHLQQIALEQQLVPLLSGVDISIAGGSDTLLANPDDPLNPGDVAQGPYPIVTADKDGNPTVIVSTDGEYSYVGRLVVNFNDQGILVDAAGNPVDDLSDLDLGVNGPVASTDENVENLWGSLADAFADGTKGDLAKEIVDAVEAIVITQDGNVFGRTDVYLDGRRTEVRTEETNFGNLTADANLWTAQQTDPTVLVSIKNGGGIRNPIGTVVETAPGVYVFLPPQANPTSGKDEGEISQLDIADSLRFNNTLTKLTVTAAQLLQVLEHAVAAVAPGATPGQFGQFGGVNFSFDPSKPAGNRVDSAVIVDDDGNVLQTLALDSEVVGDPGRGIRIVTLNFLANGGDNYPFPAFVNANPAFANRVDLIAPGVRTGNATFADNGSEQDALAEYLSTFFPADDDPNTPEFDEAETEPDQDVRVQNLSARNDGVLEAVAGLASFLGTGDADVYNGGPGDQLALSLGGNDSLRGEAGDDTLDGGAGNDVLGGGEGDDAVSGGSGNDSVSGSDGADVVSGGDNDDTLSGGRGDDTVSGGAGNDLVFGNADDDSLLGGDGNDDILGSAGSDTVDGGAGNDTIDGEEDRDVIDGGSGADEIVGDQGGDTIDGGADADTIDGGAGADSLLGGGGNDAVSGGTSGDTIGGGDSDDLLNAGGGGDSVTGDGGSDTVAGGTGDDTLTGGDGNDEVSGGPDDDQMAGGTGADTLSGNDGDDRIDGNDGGDKITGGIGDDTITGGLGSDTLSGKDGDDIFVFTFGEGVDLVTDFVIGEDLIALSGGLTLADIILTQVTDGITEIEAAGVLLARVDVVTGERLSETNFILI
jgi:YVTN family beta-propeller protein